jgi:protein-tyrosine phosphatase
MYNRRFCPQGVNSAVDHPHHLSRVAERLYLGALRDAEALATSNPHDIRSVITLCQEPVGHRSPDIQYLQFRINEVKTVDPKFLATVLAAIERSIERGPVLCHCLLGVSRSPAVLAAYLQRTSFASYEAALRYLQGLRPCVDPGIALSRGVKSALETLASGSLARSKRSKSMLKWSDRNATPRIQ